MSRLDALIRCSQEAAEQGEAYMYFYATIYRLTNLLYLEKIVKYKVLVATTLMIHEEGFLE
ncbi:hypothetical protein [Vibrio phage vB_VhaP_PG11]|nr:hypothetical protein [Vibrio phage vB_VhaP_PG11]